MKPCVVYGRKQRYAGIAGLQFSKSPSDCGSGVEFEYQQLHSVESDIRFQ